ncbi:MAG TPA: DUF6585 family protein [Ktedonosporobacter sp.]|nr:DUF6585 family protein [Ktedonosporobacter sp.]
MMTLQEIPPKVRSLAELQQSQQPYEIYKIFPEPEKSRFNLTGVFRKLFSLSPANEECPLYLYPHGILWREQNLNHPTLLRWEDIEDARLEEIFHKDGDILPDRTIPTRQVLTLKRNDGKTFNFVGNLALKGLHQIAEEEIVQRHLAAFIDIYHTRQTVSCGPVHFSQQGLRYGLSFLFWQHIQSIDFNQQSIIVRSGSLRSSFEIPYTNIPSICILKALTRYFEDQQRNTANTADTTSRKQRPQRKQQQHRKRRGRGRRSKMRRAR